MYYSVIRAESERLLTEKQYDFIENTANSAAVEIKTLQSRDRLADRTKEIKKRQLEAEADLEAVRVQTNILNDPVTL